MKLLPALGALAVMAAPISQPAVAASAQQAGAGQCSVTVDRSVEENDFDVTRQGAGADCSCYVYTGPKTQSAEIEARVAQVVNSGQCSAAREMSVPNRFSAPTDGNASELRGGNVLLLGAAVSLIAAAIVVAATSDDEEDRVSP